VVDAGAWSGLHEFLELDEKGSRKIVFTAI